MADRYFSLEEAQAMVPWLAETFAGLAPLRESIGELYKETSELQDRLRTNGGSAVDEKLDRSREALKEQMETIEGRIREVRERGILVKSVDLGLVDFPHLLDGREVYLCWQEGETEIATWHEVEAGFAGRQPL